MTEAGSSHPPPPPPAKIAYLIHGLNEPLRVRSEPLGQFADPFHDVRFLYVVCCCTQILDHLLHNHLQVAKHRCLNVHTAIQWWADVHIETLVRERTQGKTVGVKEDTSTLITQDLIITLEHVPACRPLAGSGIGLIVCFWRMNCTIFSSSALLVTDIC
jgi:hypothetical protein